MIQFSPCMNRLSSLRLLLKPLIYAQFSSTRRIRNHRQQSVTVTDVQKDGSHHPSVSSIQSYNKAVKNLRLNVNQTSYERKKDLPTSQPRKLTCLSDTVNEYHEILSHDWDQAKKISLIEPRNLMCNTCGIESIETGNNLESSCERLEPGMLLWKNYVSLNDQVDIVNMCQEFGIGPGGFYQPSLSNGAKLRLQMMCFGRNWDPSTKYYKRLRSDGSEAPPLPDKLISFCETALEDSRACLKSKDEIPSMHPNICLVNFYTSAGRLGLHQDRDESTYSLRRGLPVVSISIGDDAEFLYGATRAVGEAKKVLLGSGDVLIFGGKSRLVYHGVKKIIPDSAPLPLLKQTMLRPVSR